ncbi:YWFCY domain-containing protein [Persicobacter diffluens]|uniref:YWFCY domain-containing protein n=1 Tax=Persicobacter diffluens TaxID=981 RepID=A0AAN4W4H0_9BACT|nr:hypothetical protein PEDI_50680 [Persicobacter diffluens]
MEESKELQKLYSMLQGVIYVTILLEWLVFFLPVEYIPEWSGNLLMRISRFGIYENAIYSKFLTFFVIGIVSIGTKARKNLTINPNTQIRIPFFLGLVVFFGALVLFMYPIRYDWLVYLVQSIIGALLCIPHWITFPSELRISWPRISSMKRMKLSRKMKIFWTIIDL